MHRHSLKKCLHFCAAKSTSLGASTAGSSLSRWLHGPSHLRANDLHSWRTMSSSSSPSIFEEETPDGDLVVDPLQQPNNASSLNDPSTQSAKSGSPSPWAVYDDVWSSAPASSTIARSITPEQMSLLGPESVKIDDSAEMGSETKILDAYNSHLKSRTSSHFGYPYNLDVRCNVVDSPNLLLFLVQKIAFLTEPIMYLA
jgi:hypothetical protein